MFQIHRKTLHLSLVTYYLFAGTFLFSWKDLFIQILDHGRSSSGGWGQVILVSADLQSSSYYLYRRSSLGYLSGTLRTYQNAGCENEWITVACPSQTSISIQFAQYGKTTSPNLCKNSADDDDLHPSRYPTTTGTNNLTCLLQTAAQTVAGLCQKKPECKFQVTPQTFGDVDPCPSRGRGFVEIAYKCRPNEFRSIVACSGSRVVLECSSGSRLGIYSASYGRTAYHSLSCPQPYGTPEESCLSSFADETVMQICHGKRRCSIQVDVATFGNPCKPESSTYLKVIHTCVPRKVLKEKYRGELESDEIEDDEDDHDDDRANDDSTSRIIEQPSIPSSNYPSDSEKSMEPYSTRKTNVVIFKSPTDSTGVEQENDNHARSSAVLNSEADVHQLENNNSSHHPDDTHDVHFIYLISQGMNAYEYISRNAQTFWLLVGISMLCVFLLLLFLLLIRLIYLRRKGRVSAKEEQNNKSSTIRRASGLSDIDELSLVMDPDEYIHLPTIQRRANPSSSSYCGGGLAKNTVVRYSNSRASALSRQESDTNPRSFNQEHESDIHFFFG